MCTVLLLLRPGEPWPLLLGANRDERFDRPFRAPGRYWDDAPAVVAGLDVLGGGSWFGVNDQGVVATIVNGVDRLGPLEGKASRGELVLRALGEHDARRAAFAIAALRPERYRGFTLLVADRSSAFAVSSDERTIRAGALAPGHHMVTPEGCDVVTSPRFEAHFSAFCAAPPPDPQRGDWQSWTELLRHADEDDPHRAMTVVTGTGFGTVCSSLLALSATPSDPAVLLFANGQPTHAPYRLLTAPWARAANVEPA